MHSHQIVGQLLLLPLTNELCSQLVHLQWNSHLWFGLFDISLTLRMAKGIVRTLLSLHICQILSVLSVSETGILKVLGHHLTVQALVLSLVISLWIHVSFSEISW